MTVVQELEADAERPHLAQHWLQQRGFYRDVPLPDRADINSFLLQPELLQGVPVSFFEDPVIADTASVAEQLHYGQKRKASPTHPYMKHVYMAALQCGRLMPGGDLEQALEAYAAAYQVPSAELVPHLTICGALGHDVLEADEMISRDEFFHQLITQGVPPDLAAQITVISQFMIPGRKQDHLPETTYREMKKADAVKFFLPDVLHRLGVHSGVASRLIKASDIYANALETLDDMIKQREGDQLCQPNLFHGDLSVRLQVFADRTKILMEHDPLNPFIPDLRRFCRQYVLLDEAAGIHGVENAFL